LNTDIVKGIFFALPPIDEQYAICTHISAIYFKFKELAAEAERAIGLLKERRSALISAAVTGKIDVRGFVGDAPC
jgi:type I restriction enzyme S subunit